MVLVGCANKVGVGKVERFFEAVKFFCVHVAVCLSIHANFLCLAENFNTVLIGTGVKGNLFAVHARKTSECVCLDDFKCEADVWVGVNVGEGSGDGIVTRHIVYGVWHNFSHMLRSQKFLQTEVSDGISTTNSFDD